MRKELKDICIQIRGVSYKPTDIRNESEGIPILRANNIQDDGINLDDLVYVDEKKVYDEQYLQDGDIVICASSGSKNLVGKAATYNKDKKASFGAFCKTIRVNKSDDVCVEFIQQFFQSKVYRNAISELSIGANINNIKTEHIDALTINLPTFSEQKHIATILDKIQSAINNKKQQLLLLDEAVKSEFVEMFGENPVESGKWKVEKGENLFKFSSGKFLDAELRLEKGIPVYGGNGIAWYTEKPLINYSTIIIGRVGAYCGNVKLVSEPIWITDNALFIKAFKTNDFNLTYLLSLMEMINFSQFADKVAQPKITQSPLKDQKYAIPPLNLQNKFAAFVQQIDKSKFVVKQQIADLQELLDSKMQEYFS